jgi:hypothetical protein
MNLLFDIKHSPMAYPRLFFKEDSATYKPNVITIADSYYWNLHGSGITQRIYKSDKFWYYFTKAYGTGYPRDTDIDKIDVLKEINESDVVIYLSTDANLHRFAFGFEDKVYDLLRKGTGFHAMYDSTREARIRFIEQVIRNDSHWFQEIKRKAKEGNISVEEMLRKDAMWLYEKEKNQKK